MSRARPCRLHAILLAATVGSVGVARAQAPFAGDAPPDAPPPVSPTTARAWDSLFAPAVTPWLPPGRWNVLVVSTGPAHVDAGAARARMATALRESGRTSVVIDDEVLGDVSAIDDLRVVARAAALPVQLAVTLRIEGSGADELLTGRLFDVRTGLLLSRLSTRPGQPPFLAPARRGAMPEDDVPAKGETPAPPVPAPYAPPPPSSSSGPSLHPSQLPPSLVNRLVIFGRPRPGGTIDEQQPILGLVQGTRLRGAAFYEAVDRPDLAAEYRRRRDLQLKILVPGLCIAGAGLVGLYVSSYSGSAAAMITFGAIMLGGGGVALGSIAVRRAPVPVDEAMRLARDHNRRVKQQHGLPPQLLEDQFVDDGVSERDEPRPSLERTAAAALRLSLSPQLGPRGGGLVLVGEF